MVLLAWAPLPVLAEDDPAAAQVLARYQAQIDKGLDWLARQQDRDGRWGLERGYYPIATTGLAGLALLAEGSTPSQGKYAREIDNAVAYLLSRVQPDGRIGHPANPAKVRPFPFAGEPEANRYMFSHGLAVTFLSQVYSKEKDKKRRAQLEKALTQAVDFLAAAQTRQGGWGYVAASEGNDFSEGAATVVQVHALRAARQAGIPVPAEVVANADEYLRKSTVPASRHDDPRKQEAGLIYSLSQGGRNVRAPITAAALASRLGAPENIEADLLRQWLNHCHGLFGNNGFCSNLKSGHWEFGEYYYAQVAYRLGEDGHARLRPDLAEAEKQDAGKRGLLKWSRYREAVFAFLCQRQNADGSWKLSVMGPVYDTALILTILQLDKANLPIYQR
jgi:hypothetical protein